MVRATVYGEHDDKTLNQLHSVIEVESCVGGALMADGHLGYSMPIGGVVAYKDQISPSAVGYDIACGNLAVCTAIMEDEIKNDLAELMDEIQDKIAFGVGRSSKDKEAENDIIFDASDNRWKIRPEVQNFKRRAASQLGTVGSGNHYVDLLADEEGYVWVANHFGSRGLGHMIATGFMKLARGYSWDEKVPGESMDDPPILLDANSELGMQYIQLMDLAGEYAYAGREYVVDKVLDILGVDPDMVLDRVHVHHNYAWMEEVDGENVWVMRKGATPLYPGDRAFIGGSMGDISCIVNRTEDDLESLQSAPHGAGRVMSRTKAAGKWTRKELPSGKRIRVRSGEGLVTSEMMSKAIQTVELRGGGLDEAPQVYRKLEPVLAQHPTVNIEHRLRPIGVCMAGDDVFDPYKD